MNMEKKISVFSFLLRAVPFALVLFLVLHTVNKVQKIKGIETAGYNPVSSCSGFYGMDKNSVDVLFLGSSHCYCAFSPQMFYDQHKIRSYNLGSSQQSVWISYFWLKEALRTQNPEVVVFEPFFVTTNNGTGGNEPSVRKALDYMKLSPVKIEAVSSIGDILEEARKTPGNVLSAADTADPASFILTNLRFHERLDDLDADDFAISDLEQQICLKGWCPHRRGENEEKFTPLEEAEEKSAQVETAEEKSAPAETAEEKSAPAETAEGKSAQAKTAEEVQEPENLTIFPLSPEYVRKMADLCRERGITFLMVKTPTTHWSAMEHAYTADLAAQCGVDFIDYNVEENYRALDYDFTADSYDYGHPNSYGAEKIAASLGTILKETYGVSEQADEQWESSGEQAEHMMMLIRLCEQTDPVTYLDTLERENFTVLLCGAGDLSADGNPELLQKLSDYYGPEIFMPSGENPEAQESGSGGNESRGVDNCFCVLRQNKHNETAVSPDAAALETAAGDRKIPLNMHASAAHRSILWDDIEISPSDEGLVIIVYDELTHSIADKAWITEDGNKLKHAVIEDVA